MIYPQPIGRGVEVAGKMLSEVEVAYSKPILGKLPVEMACILRTENWLKNFQSTNLHQFKIVVDLSLCRKLCIRENREKS